MNFILNLLIFNPLEAIILVLFINSLSKEKFKVKNLLHCFVLGAVNLLVQYLNIFIKNDIMIFVYDILVALILMPFILYAFVINIYNKPIKISLCFAACLFNFITICLGIRFTSYFDTFEIWFNSSNIFPRIIDMIYVDSIIKFVQFIILFIFIKGVRFYHEKVFKENSD